MKKRKITDNIPLKIMSVAVAVVVWLIVVNIDNPVGTNYYTLNNVELINKEYVESSDTIGKMCMPEQSQDSIRVAITTTKKIRDRIKVTDISAVADLQQAVSLDTNPVMVPITVTCSIPGVSANDIKVTPQNLSVNLDEKETQEFVVNVSRGDTKPGKDYEVGSLTANPEKVRITGPKTLINKIDKVNAAIDLDGNTQDFSQDVNLTIIDKNQEPLSDSEMNSLRIENNAKVVVTARLWKIRQGVGISAGYVGTPADGYQVGSVKTVPDTISVAGSTEGLESLAQNDNVITIPADSIDISGESKDVEKKINLSNLLPDNVKLTSDSSEDVWVTVSILPVGSREFDIPTKSIEVKNKPDDLQVTFETAQIAVRIKSDENDMDDLNAQKDIKASIDLNGKEEGNYEVPVKIVLPDGYETVEDVTTEVVISSGTAVDESKS
ncbi:MAG: CdaR family protein [Blautia sp.]|uniref:CdaR family protein n=1 Tax=unclassified Blautia TaxID=2648079 RepID=UPI0025BC8752|nr:CdaR family protein [Blautia sp.]MCI6303122.1 CdaR family protein [Blautia sp.]MCI7448579.1 CdaR family protein [Blautia sp.]MDD6412570.1 CdaR family protein [Blautia sp.]MDY4115629.1 CdaR family protein [Blautia sp.]